MNATTNRDALTVEEKQSHRAGNLTTRNEAACSEIRSILAEIEDDASREMRSVGWETPASVEDTEDCRDALRIARAAYFDHLRAKTFERRTTP